MDSVHTFLSEIMWFNCNWAHVLMKVKKHFKKHISQKQQVWGVIHDERLEVLVVLDNMCISLKNVPEFLALLVQGGWNNFKHNHKLLSNDIIHSTLFTVFTVWTDPWSRVDFVLSHQHTYEPSPDAGCRMRGLWNLNERTGRGTKWVRADFRVTTSWSFVKFWL